MRTAYKCRAYPTPEQATQLGRTFGCVRLVWNHTLNWRHARWHTQRQSTSVPQANANLTAMKRDSDHAFLNEVSSVPLQQVLRHQQAAFAAFLTGRARYPRFKSRSGRQPAEYTRSGFRWRGGRLFLAKQDDSLVLVWSWHEIDPTTLDPSTVTVSRDPDGRWYVTLAVDGDQPEPLMPAGDAVGVDLGVRDFAVLSTGERVPNPGHLDRKSRNLARYQRVLARKQRGSNNRAKARTKVARAHRKVRTARADFLHKTSTSLVRRFDTIAVEDLNVAGLVRNHKLARSISDCGWGEFRRQLEYKAERSGRTLLVIDRWYPSSKTCSHCGYLLGHLSLSTRTWVCPSCGTRHDRDVNAAKNILAAGRAVARLPGDACGADVRPVGATRRRSAVNQETPSVKVGIPRL